MSRGTDCAHEFAAEEAALVNQTRIEHAVAEDELLVIDIFQEEIERGQPLYETLLDPVPFARG